VRAPTVIDAEPEGMGQRVEGALPPPIPRHGKQIFLGTSSGRRLIRHFWMAGGTVLSDGGSGPRFISVVFRSPDVAPAFDVLRTLDRMVSTATIEGLMRSKRPWPGAPSILNIGLVERFGRARGTHKLALIDPHQKVGIGSIHADMVPYQGRRDPWSDAADPSRAELEAMHGNMRCALRSSIGSGAGALGPSWAYLLYHRRKSACRPYGGGTVDFVPLGGRTAHHHTACRNGPLENAARKAPEEGG